MWNTPTNKRQNSYWVHKYPFLQTQDNSVLFEAATTANIRLTEECQLQGLVLLTESVNKLIHFQKDVCAIFFTEY